MEFLKTDIFDAVKDSNLERVRLLVGQGGDKDQVDSSGQTLLFLASIRGHIEVTQYLVEQGAALDKANNNWAGWTPLIAAVFQGHIEVCRYLLEQGADRDKATEDGGFTPLHQAAWYGRLEIAKLLMRYGADLNARNKGGQLPIDMKNDNTEEIKQAIRDEPRRRMDEVPGKRANLFSKMDLIDAVKDNNLERVRLLVGQGADKDQGDSVGWTPLFWASMRGFLDIAKYLVEQGAALDKTNKCGWTPLIVATAHGHLDVCRYLLEQGADRDKADNNGWTPLHDAAFYGKLEIAKLLMSYGADLNARSNDGQLPIDMDGWQITEEIKQAIRDEPRRRLDEAAGKRATEYGRSASAPLQHNKRRARRKSRVTSYRVFTMRK